MTKTFRIGRAGLALSLALTPLAACLDDGGPDLAQEEGEAIALPGPLPRCFGKADGDRFGETVAAGDFDGDGDKDLAVGASSDNEGRLGTIGAVYIYRRSGTSYVPWTRVSPSTLGLAPTWSTRFGDALVAADFDQDGRAELAIHQTGPDENGLYPGRVIVAGADADGTFVTEQVVTQAGLGTPMGGDHFGDHLAVGDFDADGAPDLVVAAPYDDEGADWEGRVYVFRGGTQLAPWRVFSPSTWLLRDNGFGSAIAVGDFDNNGYDDLAIGMPKANNATNAYAQGTVVTYRSIAGSPLVASRLIDGRNYVSPSGTTRAGFGTALAAADMDGDGDDELAIGAPDAIYGSDLRTGVVKIFINAVVTPSLWHTVQMPFPGARQGKSLAAGDFNGNGAVDLAVGQAVHGAIGTLLIWKGRVGTTPALGDTYDENLDAFAAADLDGDGKADLLGSPNGANAALTFGYGRPSYMPIIDQTLYQQQPGCASYWGAPPVITLRAARQRELDLRITASGTVDQTFWMRQYGGGTSWFEYTNVGDRTDTGLTASEDYCYTGKTLQVGSDAYSDWTSVCFDTAEPIPAPTISLTGSSTTSLSVRMVVSSGGDRVRSQLQNNASSSQTTTGTTVNRTFSGLSASTQYCIVADAWHPATSEWSQPRTSCFTTQSATQTGSDSVTINLQPPPPSGPIFWAGTWYADPGQRAVKLRVPASIGNFALSFVKAGYSTADCGNPNAVVTVQDGGEIDAAGIAAIQGGTPPAGQDLDWLACRWSDNPSENPPSWISFYIDWQNP